MVKGGKHSKETIEKMTKSRMGKIPWNKGLKWDWRVYKHSEDTKEKMRLAHSPYQKNALGKRWKLSPEECKKISDRIKGKGNPKWISDRTKLKRISTQGERRTSAYSEWRRQVWLRDNFKCKIANPNCQGKIEAHHILSWSEHPELRYEINNGITLCHAHHPRVRAEEKRLIPTFKELVSVSSEQN